MSARPTGPTIVPRFRLPASALLVLFLGFLSAAGQKVKQNGVAIWELPDARLQALLATDPSGDAARFERLRQLFIELGCTHPETEALDRKGHHRNLVCTLPGAGGPPILVSTWYPAHRVNKDDSRGWADDLFLAVLFHALSAEEHQHTYIFAAFASGEGEYHFFHNLHVKRLPEPAVLVSVYGVGYGAPRYFMFPPQAWPERIRPTVQTIQETAWKTASLEGLDANAIATAPSFFGAAITGVSPGGLDDLNHAPAILAVIPPPRYGEAKNAISLQMFSVRAPAVTLAAFRQDLDFAAFFLGALDLKLGAPPDSITVLGPQ